MGAKALPRPRLLPGFGSPLPHTAASFAPIPRPKPRDGGGGGDRRRGCGARCWGGGDVEEGTGVGAGLQGWAGWEGTGSLAALLEFTPHCSPCTAVYKFQARPWPPPSFSRSAPSVAQPPSRELRGTSTGPRASLSSPVSSWDSLSTSCSPMPSLCPSSSLLLHPPGPPRLVAPACSHVSPPPPACLPGPTTSANGRGGGLLQPHLPVAGPSEETPSLLR